MRSFFWILIALFAISCSRTTIYDLSVDVNNETWNRDSLAVFDININDTSQSYNIIVNIRNTVEYRYQNLYIFADIIAPNGAVQRDTIECFFADNAGRWLGRGHGALRDNRFLYRSGVRFANSGNYKFQFQQAMRVQSLQGIANVGIRIEEIDEK